MAKKAAPKPVDNQSATKCALLADQTATTSGEEHVVSPAKVSKVSKAWGHTTCQLHGWKNPDK